jgi:hypothetical protein
LDEKTNIYVNFANVLWVAFSVPSGSLSFVKYLVKMVAGISKRKLLTF